jgi:hypothetical protein
MASCVALIIGPRSPTEAVAPAFAHLKRQLFRPFRLGQWLRLGFVGLLAGEAGSGCNLGNSLSRAAESSSAGPATPQPPAMPDLQTLLIVIAVSVAAIMILAVVFTWIGSRLRFVLFDSVIAGECRIRESWRRRGAEGFSYFAFQLVLMVVSIAVVVVMVGVPALIVFEKGWFNSDANHLPEVAFGLGLLFLLALGLLLPLTIAQVLVKDFVVPQMALEGVGVREGWRRLVSMMRADKTTYASYLGLKLGLRIAATIMFFTVTAVAITVVLIPLGGLGVLGIWGAKATGATETWLMIALAVLAGAVVFLLMAAVSAIILAPVVVFFPAYSMYFFADRYPALAAVLEASPSARPGPSSR